MPPVPPGKLGWRPARGGCPRATPQPPTSPAPSRATATWFVHHEAATEAGYLLLAIGYNLAQLPLRVGSGVLRRPARNRTCARQADGSLRLPRSLSERFGRWSALPPVRFPHGQEAAEAAMAAGQAVSCRFVRRARKGREVWYVHATVERVAAEVETHAGAGAVGVDLNPGHVDVAEVDGCGNPLHVRRQVRRLAVAIRGRNTEQVSATLGEVVADVVGQAKAAGKPVVVERLDFRGKKASLREASDRQARMLFAFAYRQFHVLLRSRAGREGVQLIAVNPASTPVIGLVKFGSGHGLSPHAAAAAVAIARRGLRFGERLRSRSAFPLPARNRGKHVWSDWRRVARRLRAERARGRRPSEGGRGRGRPLSSAAPAATQGPPGDGLAAVPGCDPPAQIVGKAVRPAW